MYKALYMSQTKRFWMERFYKMVKRMLKSSYKSIIKNSTQKRMPVYNIQPLYSTVYRF